MSRQVRVFLEIGADGAYLAHLPAAPGATFKVVDPAAALAEAGRALAEELAWLGQQGLGAWLRPAARLVPPAPAGLAELVEVVRSPVECAKGDSEAYFTFMAKPLTNDLLVRGLAMLEASRRGLSAAAAAAGAGGSSLDHRPERSRRTPREVLHHLADAELYYLVRLDPDPGRARERWKELAMRGEPAVARLAAAREHLIAGLNGLDEAGRRRVNVHPPRAERWTATKVLYRAIWHERHHIRALGW